MKDIFKKKKKRKCQLYLEGKLTYDKKLYHQSNESWPLGPSNTIWVTVVITIVFTTK